MALVRTKLAPTQTLHSKFCTINMNKIKSRIFRILKCRTPTHSTLLICIITIDHCTAANTLRRKPWRAISKLLRARVNMSLCFLPRRNAFAYFQQVHGANDFKDLNLFGEFPFTDTPIKIECGRQLEEWKKIDLDNNICNDQHQCFEKFFKNSENCSLSSLSVWNQID